MFNASIFIVKTRDCSFGHAEILGVIRNLQIYFEGCGEAEGDDCFGHVEILGVIRNLQLCFEGSGEAEGDDGFVL